MGPTPPLAAKSTRRVTWTQLTPPTHIPSCFPAVSCTQHQASKAAAPHPAPNTMCHEKWRWKHWSYGHPHRCCREPLTYAGLWQSRTSPSERGWHSPDPCRSCKELPPKAEAQEQYRSLALNKRRGKRGNRTVDMRDPNRKCIFNISASFWHHFFLHEAQGFFPFIFLNDWVLLVISPVRLYYVKHLGFETGIHKQRWQHSVFGNTSLFHKDKIVPRFAIWRNTENFASYKSLPCKYMQEGKKKVKVFS